MSETRRKEEETMSTPRNQPSVTITVENEHNVRTPVPPSTAKSQKPKAFLTQSRTGSGSKYSQMSETYSIGMSTTLEGKYQNGGGLAPSKPGKILLKNNCAL